MPHPTVSFVVPCYCLGHLLRENVESILAQDYRDFEVLIMDDCSPDDTPAVAQSFSDPRVIHVRNEPNLGHLENYNHGIGLARGRYIWLISADDYLRRPYILGKYVRLLNTHPKVGYVFCSGVGVRDNRETGTLKFSVCSDRDRIFSGRMFLRRLLRQNLVLAASGLVRRECYEQLGSFPLDMPWAGDWYLWCLFAFYYDVAYFAEPMVCYREHALSMTNQLTRTQASACCAEELSIPWAIKRLADQAGLRLVSRDCVETLAAMYARAAGRRRFNMSEPVLTREDIEASLISHRATDREKRRLRCRILAALGNESYWQGNHASAKHLYNAALGLNPLLPRVLTKRILLSLGATGDSFRSVLRSVATGRE